MNRWWLCAGLWVLLGWVLPAHARELDRAEVLVEGRWQPVALPDHWSDSRPGLAGATWYRLRVDIDQPGQLLGVFLKRACNNVWIYANGQLIHSGGGPLDGPRVHRNCYFPVLAAWPRDAQRPGRNELLIRLHSEAAGTVTSEQRKGHLSTVWLDNWQLLQAVQEKEYFIRVTLPRVTSALMGFAGCMLLLLWWRYRRDPIYGFFGITMAAAGLGTARVFVTVPGVDNLVIERLVPVVAVLICLGIVGSLGAVCELRSRLYRACFGACLAVIGIMLLVPTAWQSGASQFAYGIGATAVAVTLVLSIRAMQRGGGVQQGFYLAAMVITATGLHDYLVQLRVLTYVDRPLLQVVMPVLLLAFMFRLLSRHAEALTVAENARAEMEQRIRLITREIEQSYEQSVLLQKERAARDERERIARDLHDDLGARLLTLVHRSQDEKASESAREALSDLRILIGHLNAPEGTLDEAVSDWRAEIGQRCEAAGRGLDWQAGDLPAMRLGTRQKITLGRVLREAVTNILKHTASAVVRVRIEARGGELSIDVEDESSSLPFAQWKAGVGVRNLQMRAAQIGATLHWEDLQDAGGDKRGTCLHCALPLAALDGREGE